MTYINNDGTLVDDLVYRPQEYPEFCPNHVCPNCGYCPTCGRRTWPVRRPSDYYYYEPIWMVTPNFYTYC